MSDKIRIIVIDDDTTLLEVLRLYLENCGHEVEVAPTGTEAFRKFNEKGFDIALCDYNLPDMKGLDLAAELLEKYPPVVPVLVTGVRSMDLAMEAMRRGVHDYIVKPIDYGELNKVLAEIISEKEKFSKNKQDQAEEQSQAQAPGLTLAEEPREKTADELISAFSEKLEEKVPVKKGPAAEIKNARTEGYIFSESQDKEKTIFDFVVDKTSLIKKYMFTGAAYLLLLISVFFVADVLFLQVTPVGRSVSSKFRPPYLTVDSIPSGAEIEIRGQNGRNVLREKMRTPAHISRISPGEYTLVMELTGYKTVSNQMTVSDTGQDSGNITIFGSRREYSESGTQLFTIPFELTLEIDSVPPGADVYINDTRLGNSTPMSIDVTVDRYNVVLSADGYEPLGTRYIGESVGRCLLDLRPDSDNDIDLRFWEVNKTREGLQLTGYLWKETVIRSVPEGARVYIGGDLAGYTPLETRLASGSHEVRLVSEGFTSWEGDFVVPEQTVLDAVLNKIVLFSAVDSSNRSRRLSADLWIDGEKIEGKTPHELQVEPGTRRVRFSAGPEYSDWSRNVEIGGQNQVTAQMQRRLHPVTVQVLGSQENPIRQASVYLGNRLAGRTSADGTLVLNMLMNPHSIRVDASGYEERTYDYRNPIPNDNIKIFLTESEASREMKLTDFDTVSEPDRTGISEDTSTLIIDTRPNFPGAGIFLNGEKIGETLRRVPGLAGGRHKIAIEHPYTGKVESTVSIEPGKRLIINFNNIGEAVIK